MTKKNFKASTQYNDWKGSAAADDAENDDFSDYLGSIGILNAQETVVGITFQSAPNFIDIDAFIKDTTTGNIRRINIPLSVDDFFKKFKRFSVYISRDGQLDGQDINFTAQEDE
ncbi:hypothetical protein ACUNI4_26170 [Serratia sp. IR-2025]